MEKVNCSRAVKTWFQDKKIQYVGLLDKRQKAARKSDAEKTKPLCSAKNNITLKTANPLAAGLAKDNVLCNQLAL